MRSLRNGIHPRKLLSGFIRKTQRTTTPDAPSMVGPLFPVTLKDGARDKDKDRDRDRDRDGEGDYENGKENKGGSEKTKARERERDKGPAGLPSDTRQPETVARAQ